MVRGKPGLLCRDKIMEMEQQAWLCSNNKIKEQLSWKPLISLREGIEHTASWYVNEGWLYNPDFSPIICCEAGEPHAFRVALGK